MHCYTGKRKGEYRCLIYQCADQPSVHRVTPAIVRPRHLASINRGLTSRRRGTAESDVIATSNGERMMETNICRVCRRPYTDTLEVHPKKGERAWIRSSICSRYSCLNSANFSGLCDYHYGRWQSRFYKRIQRWWRGRNVPALPKPDPRPVSFLESEL